MNKVHELKTHTEYFRATKSGAKTFEVRFDDREYEVADVLVLKEWDPKTETYSGEQVICRVTYMLEGGRFGIARGYVVMGIALIG